VLRGCYYFALIRDHFSLGRVCVTFEPVDFVVLNFICVVFSYIYIFSCFLCDLGCKYRLENYAACLNYLKNLLELPLIKLLLVNNCSSYVLLSLIFILIALLFACIFI